MTKPVALVFGATGQDASYLFELLLSKNYDVHGTIRFTSILKNNRIEHIRNKITLHYCDIMDAMSVMNVIQKVCPIEVYNLAAISHVKVATDMESLTIQTNTTGVLNILQAVRAANIGAKVYQAGTSEQFGNVTSGDVMLDENSLHRPVSIYGITKEAAYNICCMYRDAYDMFVVCGILFNHEGPRRGYNFVTQKIARHVASYGKGNKKILEIGNLNAHRDWGNAQDYVEAMWMMLQQAAPKNYVVATGECHSVREFVEVAFETIGIYVEWSGEGSNEVGKSRESGETLVVVNPKYYRDIDIECLIGDASRIKSEIGWVPKTSFTELVEQMVRFESCPQKPL